MEQERKKQKKEQSKEKELLKEYLNQYYNSRKKWSQLERRLKNIRDEMNTPIGGRGYSPVNYGGTNKIGLGAASFVYRMGEIETRIEEQKVRVEKALLKVMDFMDFLEESSTERMVLELRYIDCEDWETIGKEMHLSKSTLFYHRNKGLEKILSFKKVRVVLEEYENTE